MTALDFDKASKPALRALASPAFARVDVYADAAQVQDVWAELEQNAPCSIYQTRRFILPWTETIGRQAGLEPRFVVARDWDRRPVALLCLGLRRHGASLVATWLGGKDANFHMPLLRRPSAWTATELERLLRQVAQTCAPMKPDLFNLRNQPTIWAGIANPMALLPRQESPSAAFAATLRFDAKRFFDETLSKETRKKLRRKQAKLAELGAVTHLHAQTPEQKQRVIAAFLRQKTERLRDLNLASAFDRQEMRAFLEAASAGTDPALELHALCVDDRIVAVYGGGLHRDQWSGMVNSFDTAEEIARCSPGDLLLMRLMADCCARGVQRFDLGVGEARYKSTFCEEKVALFDVRLAISLRGRLLASALSIASRAKRHLKRDQRAMKLLRRFIPAIAIL